MVWKFEGIFFSLFYNYQIYLLVLISCLSSVFYSKDNAHLNNIVCPDRQ